MTTLRRLLLRLWNVVRYGAAERELAREMESHLSMLEEEYRRRGMSAGEARDAARRSFGRADRVREAHRDTRSLMWIEDLGRDLDYAARALRRSPSFTLAAVLTLGIAIGGATAVFSLLDSVLLRPLPFPNADRLVLLFEENARAGFARDSVRPRTYAAWAAGNELLDSVAAVAGYSVVLNWRGEPVRITARRVTASFFTVLRSKPVLGRIFRPDEDRPGADRVAIISHVGTTLLISFAAFALALAVVGLYGVIAYFVVQHVPEVGVRIALGAQPGDILRFVVARGMSLALAGVGIGTLASLVLPRLMASVLYGVSGSSAGICLAAGLLLLTLSLLASYLPARRAARLDPVAALRPK